MFWVGLLFTRTMCTAKLAHDGCERETNIPPWIQSTLFSFFILELYFLFG